ncbi:hypothetical protein [Desulfolucanica intricata]|uniref:hypothetical protein n=1 Tax=Desulfolucanica intricata TaxID=1285191 RepID=UPI0008363821|nr:hypothetical protein [Desulfolucanica intricata]
MHSLKSVVLWLLYSVYLYFAYHLLITPVILDLAIGGIVLAAAAVALMLRVVPKSLRRSVIVYSLLFLLADKAFYNLGAKWEGIPYVLGFIPVFLVLLALGKWYGRLSPGALAALVISGLLTVSFIPREEVPVLNNFVPKWESEPLYAGEVFDYFPLAVKDIDGDGTGEIITLGNASEVGPAEEHTRLPAEPLYLYVYKWNGRDMKRVSLAASDTKDLLDQLTRDYPGFPYYLWNDKNQLEPLVQRPELAGGMMQFGTAPFRAMALDVHNLAYRLQRTGGVLDASDTLEHSKIIKDVQIKDGQVSGLWGGEAFSHPTTATKIIDGMKLPGGGEGLVLLGKNLELLSRDDTGRVYVSHRITREMLKNISSTDFSVADVDGDGADELLVSSSYSRILKPLDNGKWDILWAARSSSFRFEDLAATGAGNQPELITLDKSTLDINPLRYLTGYEYSENGLKRKWKSFISLINVRAGDVDGDGQKELVGSIYRSHKLYVFERHNLPVTGLLVGITVFLGGCGLVRRCRHGE